MHARLGHAHRGNARCTRRPRPEALRPICAVRAPVRSRPAANSLRFPRSLLLDYLQHWWRVLLPTRLPPGFALLTRKGTPPFFIPSDPQCSVITLGPVDSSATPSATKTYEFPRSSKAFWTSVRLPENHAHSESFLPSRLIYGRHHRSDFAGAAQLLSSKRRRSSTRLESTKVSALPRGDG